MDLASRARKIKLLLMDCDGVLTDGRLYFSASGEALKVFHVRDGQGLVAWHSAGFQSGIISGREAEAIILPRASELGIRYVRTGSTDKAADLLEVLGIANVSPDEVAFIGDDTGDIPIMNIVGLPVAVGDAVEATKATAVFVTKALGGCGAVRELVDMLLDAKRPALADQ